MGCLCCKNSKRIKSDQDVLRQTKRLLSLSISNNGRCSSDENNICDFGRTEGCWDVTDTEWMMNMSELQEANRIYVHGEILEWMLEQINENILNDYLRATVEEVHHHNLNGPIYLIQFYTTAGMRRMLRGSLDALQIIKVELTYKIPGKPNPKYFLRMDLNFENRKMRIMNRLRELNLHTCFKTVSLDVNWLYFKKIEIYEFLEYLPEYRMTQFDCIFEETSNCQPSINICNQFEWHQKIDRFVEVDKLAMDICVEEWRRHDLLKDFTIEDILRLDLANKDYRDPYFNVYLDRYLDILLKTILPQLFAERNEKLELPLHQWDSYLANYFVSRFYDKISIVCDSKLDYIELQNRYDVSLVEKSYSTVDLNGDQPPPSTLLKMKHHIAVYNLTNYIHFSESLFRTLLNKSTKHQTYNIRFDKDFQFVYDNEQQQYSHLTNVCNWPFDNKQIIIELLNCIDNNADKLADFVKYLINLFNERMNLGEDVSICFNNCILEDYSFLENIGNGIDKLKFVDMNISSQQISVLSRILTQQSTVSQTAPTLPTVLFSNCKDLTDNNVMTLLENIDLNRLFIRIQTACTPALFYLMAEHLMNKEGVNTIEANRFNKYANAVVDNFNYWKKKFQWDLMEFFKDANQIVARFRHSKEIVDLNWIFYCHVNRIEEDESIDPYNKMFME